MQNNSITSQTDIANVTVVTEENQIIVPQPITSVIEVNNPGPQGPVGPQGVAGPSEPFSNIGGDVYATTSSLQVSGSFLVSGSSTFTNIGPAIFSGSATITGPTTMSSAVVTGNVQVLGTASINVLQISTTINSTGSNILGDAANDTQTLFGTVRIPTGSLTVSGSTIISSSANTQLQVGSNLLFVSSSGRVGIGAIPSLATLDVNGNINSSNQFRNTVGMTIGTVSGLAQLYQATGVALAYFDGANTINGLTLRNTGYVGIGPNITPSASLHIKGATTSSLSSSLLIQDSNASASFIVRDDGRVGIGKTPSSPYRLDVNGGIQTNEYLLSPAVYSLTNLQFGVSGGTVHFRMLANGNVQIFNSIPPSDSGYKLDVRGEAIISSSLTLDSQPIFRVASGLAVNVLDVRGNGNMVLGGSSDVGIGTGLGVFTRYSLRVGSLSYTDASAILQADSTTRGFLPPRTSATSLISSPAQGLITYVTGSNDGLYYYNSGSQPGWHEVLTNTGSQSITGSLEVRVNSATSTNNALRLSNTQGNAGIGTGLVFYSDTTPSQGVFNTGRIYSDFPGFLYTDARMIFQTPTADSTWTDTLTLKGSSVGIGTTSPSENLHVSGNILIGQYASSTSLLRFANISNAGNSAFIGRTAAAGFEIQPGSVSEFRINTPAGSDTNPLTIYGNGVRTAQFYRNSRTRFGGNLSTNPGSTVEIVGEGATNTTTALTVQNSSAAASLRVRDDSSILFGGSLLGLFPSTDKGQSVNSGAGGLFIGYLTTGDLGYIDVPSVTIGRPINRLLTGTSGTQIMGSVVGNYSPTSGTGAFTALEVVPTINQTGGANGITRGLYINPTLTSAANWRAIEVASGASILNGVVAINSTNISTGYALFVNGVIGASSLTLTQNLTMGENFAISNNGSQTIDIDANNDTTNAVFRVTANGTANELFRVNESGNFGIGTIAPTYTLDVSGSAGSTARFRGSAGQSTVSLNDGTNDNIIVGLSGRLQLRPSGNTTLTALATGEIGIGTITPTSQLHVSGSASAVLLRVDSPASSSILYVSGSGNVGINTSNPTTPLDINRVGTGVITRFLSNGSSVAYIDSSGWASVNYLDSIIYVATPNILMRTTAGLTFSSNTNSALVKLFSNGNFSIGTTTDTGAKLNVRGSGATSATTALRVENTNASASLVVLDNGYVGIGTSSAQYQLDVYGTYHQYQAQGEIARYDISSANANQNRGVWNFYTNAAASADFFGRFGFKFEGGTTDSFKQFQVHVADSTTPKFVIDGSGRVGIGTTSSLTILDVRTSNNSSITPLSIAPNDATTLLVGNTGTNGVLAFGQNNTGQGWIQGRSRLAGGSANPILLNPLGGNVLVGTTTDLGYKLDVSGSTRLKGNTIIEPVLDNNALYISSSYSVLTIGNADGFVRTLGIRLGLSSNNGLISFTRDSSGVMFGQFNQNGLSYLNTGGNFSIGTTSDIGGKLSVRGSGTTNATTTFLLQNSTPTNLLSVLDNGQVAFTSPTMSLAASQSAFSISPIISASNIVGGQYYGVSITPTFFQTTGSQTETAFRVAATFTSSNATATTGSNIIADFGSTSAGSQLTVTDVTSGSIYMVNDVSGIPIIEATSNWDVNIYDFPNKVFEKTGSQVNIYGTMRVSGSFILPLSQSATPQTGSAYWSGSLLFIYNGTRYMSASFA